MATQPPPPHGPAGKQPNQLRTLGLLIALSTPISGFLLWIVVAVIVGEDRLEGESGQTALGLGVLIVPLVVGLGIAAFAHLAGGESQMSALSLGIALLSLGLLLVSVGIFSVLTADDASIGGGILVLAGLTSIAVGWFTRN